VSAKRLAGSVLCVLGGALVLESCVSRAGWGRGRLVVVHESQSLQVRRSSIRVDEGSGDLVMNWIGARAPDGQPLLTGFTVTGFDDRDGNGAVGLDELRFQRTSQDTTPKVLFSDLRLLADVRATKPIVLVETRTAGGEVRTDVFAFVPD
jgi:hypothetical protein